MFEIDGVTFASAPVRDMRVTAAQPLSDFMMLVTFSTGEQRLVDGSQLSAYPAFSRLAEAQVWANPQIDHGVLTWDQGKIDISPAKLYELGYEYAPALV